MNGCIVYQGPSGLNGEPIVAIATGLAERSANRKTGAMLQVWILPQCMTPNQAQKWGFARSVCGSCPHADAGSCYVTLHQAPRSVWEAWKRGVYPLGNPNMAQGRALRWGAWGDPAALPESVVHQWSLQSARHTGYTHQWRDPQHAWLRAYVMASCDTPEESIEAQAKGWRTFRVRLPHEPLAASEIICPAADEAGKRTNCASCTLCDGTYPEDPRRSIAIIRHGSPAKVAAYDRLRVIQEGAQP